MILAQIHSALRRLQLECSYLRRRERYSAGERARAGARSSGAEEARRRIAARGWSPRQKRLGEYHTLAFIPQVAWHGHLVPDLRALGRLSLYDYVSDGYSAGEFRRGRATGLRRREEMNRRFVEAALWAHRESPLDWIFVYGTGLELLEASLESLKRDIGAPLVLMCLDDKQSWDLRNIGGQNSGQRAIVKCFDLCWTSASACLEWYAAEQAAAVYLPEGFDANSYRPKEMPYDIDISFVGARYGFRAMEVDYIRRHGLKIEAFGEGWENPSVWDEAQVDVFNRSRINLGMGGILHSPALTNVKTRDFEIPGCGGGVYLTTYNRDLANHYVVGKEIFCYRDRFEMVEMLRELLADPEACRNAARAARERCLLEHRWLHRYQTLLKLLGL